MRAEATGQRRREKRGGARAVNPTRLGRQAVEPSLCLCVPSRALLRA